MALLRVTRAFPYATSTAQGYEYAVPGQILEVTDPVWHQLVDEGFGEAPGSEVVVEVECVVHRAASARIEARSYAVAYPAVDPQ